MKIDNNINNNPALNVRNLEIQPKEAKKPSRAPKIDPEATQTSGDTVILSDRSRLIAKAQELVALAPETRAEKVADLTARIAAGTYNVKASVVADSIIKKSVSEIV